MELTPRFLEFAQRQLEGCSDIAGLEHVGLYISRSDQQQPVLDLVSQWPAGHQQLPPADRDADLRRSCPNADGFPCRTAAPSSEPCVWTSMRKRLGALALNSACSR